MKPQGKNRQRALRRQLTSNGSDVEMEAEAEAEASRHAPQMMMTLLLLP